MANKKSHSGANVPALRFPEFSGEWKMVSLQDIAIINPKSSSLHSVFYYIDLESVEKGELKKRQEIHREEAPSRAQRVIGINDILFQCVRPYQKNNYINRIQDTSSEQWVASTGYAQIRTTETPNYIYHLLNTDGFNAKVLIRCTGSSYPAINSEDLATIRFYISADRIEQLKISRLLDLLDERIATQSRIIEELTTLRSALIEKCSTQEGNVFERSDILKEIDNRSSFPNQYQVLSSTVKGIYSQKEYFNKEIASEDNKGYKVVKKGNVVLSPQNLWMGNINFNDRFDVGIVSPSYKVFSIKKGFNPFFIAALLKTKKALYEYLLSSEQGASVVRRNLNAEALMAIKFKIPETSKQDALANAINAIDRKMKTQSEDSLKRKKSLSLKICLYEHDFQEVVLL